MQSLSLEDWVFWIAFINFLLLAIASFAFGRISLPYIEKQMVKEGTAIPDWDKGIGGRAIVYAMAILIGKGYSSIMVDNKAILKHTRKLDWYLALLLVLTVSIFFISGCILYFNDS